jgi:hypothetical protein
LSSTPQPKRRSKRISARTDDKEDEELTASEVDNTDGEEDPAVPVVYDDARSVDSMLGEDDEEAADSDSDV